MATVRRHNDAWVADYVDQWGKRHRERPKGSFRSKNQERRAAQALLKKRLDEVFQNCFVPTPDRLIVSKLAEQFLESKINIRPTTRRSYRSLIDLYINPIFGQKKVDQVSVADFERLRNALAKGRPHPVAEEFAKRMMSERPALNKHSAMYRVLRKKPGVRTINKVLSLAVSIFKYAERHRWVDHNPAIHVEKLRRPVSEEMDVLDGNVLTPEEIGRLINAAEPGRRNADGKLIRINHRLVIKFAVLTGLRGGEICGLQWGDIDWESRQVHVRRAWKEGHYYPPKTQASLRRVELPERLTRELREWKLACPKGRDDLVFPNLKGNPMSSSNLLKRGLYPALRRAGLRKIRFHDLRHTYASILIESGENIVCVSRQLGHSSPNVTLSVYSHALPRSESGCAERLDAVLFPIGKSNVRY
jgi:integrase